MGFGAGGFCFPKSRVIIGLVLYASDMGGIKELEHLGVGDIDVHPLQESETF